MLQNVRERIVLLRMGRFSQQMDDDFRVGGALKNVPVLFVLLTEKLGIDQVAVMRHRDGSEAILAEQRLGIAKLAGSGGRIADVPNRRHADQLLPQQSRVKHLAHQSHAHMAIELPAIGHRNARGFLAAMLLGEQALIADLGGLRRTPDAEKAAFFFFFVFVERVIHGVQPGLKVASDQGSNYVKLE